MKRSVIIIVLSFLVIGVAAAYAYSRLSTVSFDVQGISVTYEPPRPWIGGGQTISVKIPGAKRAVIQVYGWMPNGSLKLLTTSRTHGETVSLSIKPIRNYIDKWGKVLGISKNSPRPGVLLVGFAEDKNGLHLVLRSVPLDIYLVTKGYSVSINLGTNALDNKKLLFASSQELGKYIEPKEILKNRAKAQKSVSSDDEFPPNEVKLCYQDPLDDTLYICYVLKRENTYAVLLDKGLPIILTHVSAHNSLNHLHHITEVLNIDYSSKWIINFDFNMNALIEKTGADAGYSYSIPGPSFQLSGGRLWFHHVTELKNHAYKNGQYINLDNTKEAILALGIKGDAALAKYHIKKCKSYLWLKNLKCKDIGDFYVALVRPRITNNQLVPWEEIDLNPAMGSTTAAKAYNIIRSVSTLHGTKVAYDMYDHYVYKNKNAEIKAPGSLTASLIVSDLLTYALSAGLSVSEALPLLVLSIGPSISLDRINSNIYMAESIVSLNDDTTAMVGGYYRGNTKFLLMSKNTAYYVDSMYIDVNIEDSASHIYGWPGQAS
ncbi:hypothetical protein PYJP_16170 [Pyrofollis japonicus]|uniref:hypothetical protein n=1 Tax=Pyrofollis japonicus TaxID=3060460 RepID=UPI00295B3A4D|nr:hypothetical protein [Pyrofollis japonicus]BEP18265.1 hypothetical protein PYJP_16170 [Pyrofollis japonicus]